MDRHFLGKLVMLLCRVNPRGGGGVLDQWLGIGVRLRVSNPDPV